MSLVEELVRPLSLKQFLNSHFQRAPFAAPFAAQNFRNLIDWPLLKDILATNHDDCWLVKNGFKHPLSAIGSGLLDFRVAQQEFSRGYSIVVRHAEKAHPKLNLIAESFYQQFKKPIDIQLYCTPSGNEGFDWHYDIEDVFVIQSKGEKEFRLKNNTVNPNPRFMPHDLRFSEERTKTEIRCWLKSGDWLYIPKGYWHKAQALTDSFHLSVGVLH